MSLNLPDQIDGEEILFRGVHPNNYDFERGRLTSALFKDKLGPSVDRQGDRTESLISEVFAKRFPGFGLAKFSCQDCRDAGADVRAMPETDNIYHAIITQSDGTPNLSHKRNKNILDKLVQIASKNTLRLPERKSEPPMSLIESFMQESPE